MNTPTLYRKRLIPEECIKLKDDEILFINEERIITKWNSLKPRKDIHHGYSCYFFNEGIKVSKFYKADGSLLYWYCDIVSYDINNESNEIIVTDLLADVIIYPDGFVKVVDIDEMVTCLDNGKISLELLKKSLTQLDKLLKIIYAEKFDTLTIFIEDAEK